MILLITIGAVLGVAALYVLVPMLVDAYRTYRGERIITCPETGKAAAVEVDAGRAAMAALRGSHALQLRDCSRWPERAGCGQDCLAQIEESPQGCLVRSIVARWYDGKTCALCGATFDSIESWEHHPALRSPDGTTMEWSEVAPERLPEIMQTHAPVCWNCHVAESFRVQHPELVTDRPYVRDRTYV